MINGLQMKGYQHVLIKFLILLLWIQDISGHDELTCFTLATMTHVNIGCPAGSRILVTSAIYGASPFGLCYGTGKDCTQEVPLPTRCCGRQACTFDVRNRYLTKCMQPATYYQVYYMCVKGEVECQDTDVTEDLPLKESDKSLTNNNDNDLGRPSTKIFLLNEGKHNDTEGTTGPTPRDSDRGFESTTFPSGMNLLLTPQVEHDGIYKTQTESPLDTNKTTKKRMGKLILFLERRGDEISRKYDISDKRFLRRRGQIWRIKGDVGSQIETSSALTPTGAVTREGNRAPQHQRPFPGGNTGYQNRALTPKTFDRHEDNRYKETSRSHRQQDQNQQRQHQETHKINKKLQNYHPLPEKRPKKQGMYRNTPEKNVRNLFHSTTPVDQLQVIRMMAERIRKRHEYKQHRSRYQPHSTEQQRSSKNIFNPQETESNIFKEKAQVQETQIGVKYRNKGEIEKEVEREKSSKRNAIQETNYKLNRNQVANDRTKEGQSKDDEHSQKHSGHEAAKREFRTRDPLEEGLKENSSSIDTESGNTDAVTPPTLFHKDESNLNSKQSDSVQRDRDRDVHRIIENILPRMEVPTVSSPILPRIKTSIEVPSSRAATEESSITSMHPPTLLTSPQTTARTMKTTKKSTMNTSTTTSSATRNLAGPSPTTVALLKGGASDFNKKQSRNTYNKDSKLQIAGSNKFHFREDRNNLHHRGQTSSIRKKWKNNTRGVIGQNIRRHLSESVRDLYHDHSGNKNTQEIGTQPIITFTPRMTRIRPAVKWDGRRSTISNWLKTLKPAQPHIPTKLSSSPISRVNRTSTIHDDRYWKNNDVTSQIYQQNGDRLIRQTRISDTMATTESTSTIEVVTKNLGTSDLPYNILMEEEKIATQFTDISISLGTLLTIAGGEALIFLILLIVLGLYLKRFDLEKSGSEPANNLSISTSLKRLRRHYKRRSKNLAGYTFGTTSNIPGAHLSLSRSSIPAWRQIKIDELSPKRSTNFKYPHRKGEVNTVCNTIEAAVKTNISKNKNVPQPYIYEEACTAFNVPSIDGRKSACPSEGRRYAAAIGELSKTISKAQAHDTKEDEDSMYALSAEEVYTDDSSYNSSPITYENVNTHTAQGRIEERSPSRIKEKLKVYAENELEKIDEQIHILLHGLRGNTDGIESNV